MPPTAEAEPRAARSARPEKRPGREAMIPETMKAVLLAGAMGGLVSWVYSETVGRSLGMQWYLGIPACLLLGSVAGVLGVYIIAKTDTRERVHLLAFAILCGILWRPIIDSARAYVQLKSLDENATSKAESAIQGLGSAPAAASATKAEELGDAATHLVKTSALLADPKRDPHTEELVKRSAQALQRSGPAGERALMRLRAEAVESKNPRLIEATKGR
jgi:hypothetical protein